MPFSNFYNCYFTVDLPQPKGKLKSTKIHSVEQLYMFRKSLYFQDHVTCELILKARDAVTTKHLSKQINGFVSESWEKVEQHVMLECLVRKFTDSDKKHDLSARLLSSPDIIVEASPPDTRWGIGFGKEDGPFIAKQDWGDGINLLGRLLMALRTFLKARDSMDANIRDPLDIHNIHRKVQRQQLFVYNKTEYDKRDPPLHIPFRVYLKERQQGKYKDMIY
jgi:ribA/ribD-fused uncharacterized protein